MDNFIILLLIGFLVFFRFGIYKNDYTYAYVAVLDLKMCWHLFNKILEPFHLKPISRYVRLS